MQFIKSRALSRHGYIFLDCNALFFFFVAVHPFVLWDRDINLERPGATPLCVRIPGFGRQPRTPALEKLTRRLHCQPSGAGDPNCMLVTSWATNGCMQLSCARGRNLTQQCCEQLLTTCIAHHGGRGRHCRTLIPWQQLGHELAAREIGGDPRAWMT